MNFPFRVTQKVCQNENRSLTVNTFFIYLSNKTTINIPILLKYKIIQIIIYFENNLNHPNKVVKLQVFQLNHLHFDMLQ